MNLTSDPWIPIVWQDGRAGKVSLKDAFLRGEEIRDLAMRPHERIALMRLLICVAQAALDGPKDRADWLTCANRLPEAAAAYLDQWVHAFELLGDGQRFLQVEGLRPVRAGGDDEGNSVSKMDLALATGNTSTLFDNAGGGRRSFSSAEVALMLLTFQNFSPGGLIGDVSWHGQRMGRSSNHAPCVIKALAHALVKGDTLGRGLHLNLLTQEATRRREVKWGQPLWERPPTSPSDRDSIQNATATYLGRLVPLARLVWLGNHDDLILGNGPTYEGYPHWREATATIVRKVRNDTEERVTLAASVSKSTWREIPAVSVIERAGGDPLGGPLALQNLSSEESCEIWVGALIADKAKPIDAIESVYFLPAAMFTDPGRGRYEAGVRSAEAWNARLGKAIAKYRRELKDEIEGDQWKRGAKVKHKAATHYWTAVEQNVSDLLAVVDKPELLHSDGSDSGGDDWHQTAWGRALRYAARSAYDLACPHKTPRQLKAYALGLKALFEERPAVAANADDLPDTEAPNA